MWTPYTLQPVQPEMSNPEGRPSQQGINKSIRESVANLAYQTVWLICKQSKERFVRVIQNTQIPAFESFIDYKSVQIYLLVN